MVEKCPLNELLVIEAAVVKSLGLDPEKHWVATMLSVCTRSKCRGQLRSMDNSGQVIAENQCDKFKSTDIQTKQ